MVDDTAAQSIRLTTADGPALEAEVVVPAHPRGALVLAHPHPQQGGSMRSLVTSELFRILPAHDLAVLRFNFRGVGASEGTYGGGRAEHADVVGALDGLRAHTDAAPLVLLGWSFGADVALSVTDDRIDGWVAVAPPLAVLPLDEMTAAHDPRPKMLVVPEHDELRPPGSAREATAEWANTSIEVIRGAGHFLVGRTDRLAELVAAFTLGLPT